MNSQLIIDLMHQQLLPRILRQDFGLLPSAEKEILYSKNYQPIFPYSVHSHSFFEWVWCMENHAFLKIKNQVYRLGAGDFCLLPPGEMHADVYIPSLNPYQVLWCSYQNETVHLSIHAYTPVNHLQCLAEIFVPAPSVALSLLSTLQHELKTGLAYRETVCRAFVIALAHLMLRVLEKMPKNEAPYSSGKISVKVDNYLNEHFSESFTLTDVAHALHISRNHLDTLYKRETGKTMGHSLKEIRLEHAKRLLLETQLSVKDVAKAVGYLSPEHFSRFFYQETGVTPGSYGK